MDNVHKDVPMRGFSKPPIFFPRQRYQLGIVPNVSWMVRQVFSFMENRYIKEFFWDLTYTSWNRNAPRHLSLFS